MQKIIFPNNFWWGSATSGPQTEEINNELSGGKSETIWERTFSETPEKFFDNNPTLNNYLKNYKKDIQIASDLNFNSLRTSILWSRLIPDGKNINHEAVEYYNDMINEMIDKKIEPFINLFHFDMPMWAMEQGGWTNREVVEAYAFYAKTAFKLFGDRVKKWFTFNEPIVSVECQYQYQFHYPFIVDFNKSVKALWGIIMAHHLSVKEFRKLNLLDAEIGTIVNITPAISRSESKKDLQAADFADMFQWRTLLDSFINGEMPNKLINKLNSLTDRELWPNDLIQPGDKQIIENNLIDLIGINYYSPLRVKAVEESKQLDWSNDKITPSSHFFNSYSKPNVRINHHRGWEIHPKSIYSMLKVIQNDYGNIKHFVAENGMGVEGEEKFKNEDGIIHDDYRIDFLTEHLYWIHKAMGEGANCLGYHMWTYIDNWSWLNAYKNRYGFISLDIETGKRTSKMSAEWIKTVIQDNKIIIKDDLVKNDD